MEPHLAKACRRAATKVVAGVAVLGAVVGLRIVTATPRGIEAELAELERFEAERTAGAPAPASDSGETRRIADDPAEVADAEAGSAGADDPGWAASVDDPDRLVKCGFGTERQYTRAADCETRGGRVEELPPPRTDDPPAAPGER